MVSKEIERSRLTIQWGGTLGMLAHPIYYFVWTVLLPQPYDNLWLRLSAAAFCIPLVAQKHWPKKLESFLSPYWQFCLIYVLPFTCTFLTIKNGFSTMWMMTEVMIIFIMALCVDIPLLLLAYIVIGMALAFFATRWGATTPFVLSKTDQSDLALLPIVALGSMLFSQTFRKKRAVIEKNNILQALAGSIAHEMRNPLSQIKSSLDGIEKNLPIPTRDTASIISTQRIKNLYEYVSVGGSAIRRGLQVIAMILDEVKDKPINPKTFNYLHAVQATQKAIAEYGYETEGERYKVNLEIKRNFIFKGDETLYLFVLFNLIKNALYYFKLSPQAKITITIDQSTVTVRDTGPGIPKENLPQLFESFHTSGKQGGTGLGLAYCKRVMQAFGGDIRCQSVVDKYTEFILDFPKVSDETWQQYQNSMIERIRPLLSGKRLLIVDDDETIRIDTQTILQDLGLDVDQAEDGQQALDKLTQSSYDLMLLDLKMPVLNGYATAEKIRSGAIPGSEHIPIVAYTTEVAYMAKVKTEKVGIDAFVSKPCEPSILLQIIEETLTSPRSSHRKAMPYPSLINKTILIADDSETNRDLLKIALKDYGINILEAEHGLAALDKLNAYPDCDAVLMDMHMPGISGIETTFAIRNRENSHQLIPILVMTGDTNEENIKKAYAAGINDYIAKPINMDMLLDKLVMLCDKEGQYDDDSLFDLERLDTLRSRNVLKNGEDNSYVKQTREWMTKLERAVHEKDIRLVQDALHFLKGASHTVGAHTFAELIHHHEKQCINNVWPLEENWPDQIKVLHTQTLAALQAHFVD